MRKGAFVAILALAGLALPATAQAPDHVELRLDNDYFNLWDGFWDRPDSDYTHGTKIGLSWRLTGGGEDAGARSLEVEFGQLIFNPSNPALFCCSNRPYAGWLYLTGQVTDLRPTHRLIIGAYVGATGSASLAEGTQRRFHEWAGRMRNPEWTPVLRDELGAGLLGRIGWQRDFARSGPAFIAGAIDLGADLGTMRVEGTLAPSLELGVSSGLVELRTRVSNRIRLRGHDAFVEGSILSGPSYADLNTRSTELGLEVGLRVGPVTARYQVTRKSREFESQMNPHTYSGFSLGVGVTPDLWLPAWVRTWKP